MQITHRHLYIYRSDSRFPISGQHVPSLLRIVCSGPRRGRLPPRGPPGCGGHREAEEDRGGVHGAGVPAHQVQRRRRGQQLHPERGLRQEAASERGARLRASTTSTQAR